MKKYLFLILALVATKAHAVQNEYGDIFPYENRHATFSYVLDAGQFTNTTIQVVYSTPTCLALPFTSNQVNVVDDTILGTSHGLPTGLPVLLASAPATGFSPLTAGTTYFVIKITDNLVKLATTYAQAVTGDAINILSITNTSNFTLLPVPLSLGSANIAFSASNDGTNFVVMASSVGLTTQVNGSTLFDFSGFTYRLLKFTFNGPTAGVVKLRAFFSGRK